MIWLFNGSLYAISYQSPAAPAVRDQSGHRAHSGADLRQRLTRWATMPAQPN